MERQKLRTSAAGAPTSLRSEPAVFGSFHERQNFLIVTFRCPYSPEKVSGMEAMLPEKMTVSTAAIHDVMAERAFEKTAGLLDDSRKPRNPIERGTLRRQLVGANFRLT